MPKKELRESLLEKGWKVEEVEKALDTLYRIEPKKEKHHKKMNRILYWSTLVLVIVANTVVSIVMVPFLLILSRLSLYFIISVLGLVFGALFNLLIRDIEHIDPRHHIIAGIFLPAIAIVNIYVMVNFANRFNEALNISPVHQNPVIVSAVYVIAFLLPYVIDQGFVQKIIKKGRSE
jgi:hypothetical protein